MSRVSSTGTQALDSYGRGVTAVTNGLSEFHPRELVFSALICALIVTLFLSPALLRGRLISPADMLFDYFPWMSQRPNDWTRPSNDLLIDSVAQFEPWSLYSAERLGDGTLPLWNPHDMLGAPFLANMQSGVFSPLNWPSLLQPQGLIANLRPWLKLFVAMFGTYVLARRVLIIGPLGAALASLTFGLGSFMVVWLLHPHTAVVIWLPWLWLATASLVRRPHPRSLAVLAIVVALSLLGGHPETTYHVAWATGLFMLFYCWCTWGFSSSRAGQLFRVLGAWAAAFVLGALISSIQVLPFLEYTGLSAASAIRSDRQDSVFSLPILYAWTSLAPDMFGNPAQHTWWGMAVNFNESNNYCGVLPLLLAPFSLVARDQGRRRFAIFLLILVVLSMALVYGFPVLSQIVLAFPGMRLTLITRMVVVTEFGLGLMAALGIEGIKERLAGKSGLLVAVVVGLISVWLCIGVLAPWLLRGNYLSLAPDLNYAEKVLRDALMREILFLLLSGAIITFWVLSSSSRLHVRIAGPALWLLPLLLAIDLFTSHISYVPSVDPAQYYVKTPSIRFLENQPGLFRIVGGSSVFFASTNLEYNLNDLRGSDAIEPLAYRELAVRQALKLNSEIKLHPSPVLNLLNVRYLLAAPGDDPRTDPTVISSTNGSKEQRPWLVKVLDGGSTDMSVYENLRVLPRAWLVHQVEVQPDSALRLKRLAEPDFPAANVAVLNAPLDPAESLPEYPLEDNNDIVTVKRYSPEAVEIQATTSQPGLLILGDQAFPGWKAEVDGQDVKWVTADHSLRGVYLSAGSHQVGFRYAPESLSLGAAMSAIGLIVTIASIIWRRDGVINRRFSPSSGRPGLTR